MARRSSRGRWPWRRIPARARRFARSVRRAPRRHRPSRAPSPATRHRLTVSVPRATRRGRRPGAFKAQVDDGRPAAVQPWARAASHSRRATTHVHPAVDVVGTVSGDRAGSARLIGRQLRQDDRRPVHRADRAHVVQRLVRDHDGWRVDRELQRWLSGRPVKHTIQRRPPEICDARRDLSLSAPVLDRRIAPWCRDRSTVALEDRRTTASAGTSATPAVRKRRQQRRQSVSSTCRLPSIVLALQRRRPAATMLRGHDAGNARPPLEPPPAVAQVQDEIAAHRNAAAGIAARRQLEPRIARHVDMSDSTPWRSNRPAATAEGSSSASGAAARAASAVSMPVHVRVHGWRWRRSRTESPPLPVTVPFEKPNSSVSTSALSLFTRARADRSVASTPAPRQLLGFDINGRISGRPSVRRPLRWK